MPDNQQPVTLDMATAQPIQQPTLDMSTAQPIQGQPQGGEQGPTHRYEDGKIVPIGDSIRAGLSEVAQDPMVQAHLGAAKGALQTVGGLTSDIGEVLNRIPGVGETLAPRAGLNVEEAALRQATERTGLAQKAGGVAEEGLEWVAGDAALKSLSKMIKVAQFAPRLLELVEKYPTTARLLLAAGRGGTVGGAQAAAKAPGEGESAVQAAKGGAAGGALGGTVGELIGMLPETKIARGLINRSMGATARDVTYGNPALALLDEDLGAARTGNLEAYKSALRTGKTSAEASKAAGGRIAAINGRINELSPQLNAALKASSAKVPVADVIDKPLNDALLDISNNRAMTQAEKDAATSKLGELKVSLKNVLGESLTPAEAVEIKRQIGERINWGGTTAVTDEVKPVYREIYGALKNAVHQVVPEAAPLDERLTNLYAAQKDVLGLAAKEEVGAGKGIIGSNFWDVPQRLLDELGRIMPAIKKAAPALRSAGGFAGSEAGRAALPKLSDNYVRFMASDGSIHDVPSEHLDAARKIDPKLTVMPE